MKLWDSQQNWRSFSLSHPMGEGKRSGEGRAFAAPEWVDWSDFERLRPRRRGEGILITSLAYLIIR
jgi:hypothetical protein